LYVIQNLDNCLLENQDFVKIYIIKYIIL
jgi:hypothetical protein